MCSACESTGSVKAALIFMHINRLWLQARTTQEKRKDLIGDYIYYSLMSFSITLSDYCFCRKNGCLS